MALQKRVSVVAGIIRDRAVVITIDMKYLVDVQGIKLPHGEFIVKELAALSLNEEIDSVVLMFEEPCPWEKVPKEKKWLKRYYPGLEWGPYSIPNNKLNWYSRGVPYHKIEDMLQSVFENATKILTMGLEKVIWLEDRLKFKIEIQDIAEEKFPPLDKIKLVTHCPYHHMVLEPGCALHNVRLMKKYLKERSSA